LSLATGNRTLNLYIDSAGALLPAQDECTTRVFVSQQSAKARLKVMDKEMKSLQWEHEVLEQRFEKVTFCENFEINIPLVRENILLLVYRVNLLQSYCRVSSRRN